MRLRLGRRSMEIAALCLVFLLVLPQCSMLGPIAGTPTGEPTADAGASAAQSPLVPTPAAEATTPAPGPTGPLATIREVFDWLVLRVGRTGLLAIVVAVIVLLVALFVILLIRMLVRSSKPAVSSPPARPVEKTAPMPPLKGATAGPAPADQTPAAVGSPEQTTAPSGATLVMRSAGEVEPPPAFPLKPSGVTIGREPDNDLVIDEATPGADSVSRHHARIYLEDGRWIVEDLDSQNGVYVNGRRTGRNMLQDGWTLGIGSVQFTFHNGTGRAAS